MAADPTEDPDGAIEEVVVTATRSAHARGDSAVATKVIDRQAIEDSGAEDVADLLEQVPGVDIQRSYLGASVRLQGMDPEHVLVLVDGQRVNGRVGGAVDLSRFPVDAIERIEIVEGTGSALYGSDAMGGVVHIITRKGSDRTTADLHGRGGTQETGDGRGGLSTGNDTAKARLDVGVHHNAPTDLSPADLATTGNGQLQGQASGRLDLDAGVNADLTLSASYSRLDADGVDLSTGGAVFDRRNLTEEARVSVEPRILTDANGQLRVQAGLSAFRDQYLLDQQGADALDDYADTRDLLAQLGVQVQRVARRHDILLGAEGIAEQLSSERLGGGTGARQRAALYAQDEWRPTDTITLLPSARVDVDTSFGTAPTVRLASRAAPTDALAFRASVGTGYRAPSFREQLLRFDNSSAGYRVEGNPDLRPERSLQASGAAEFAEGRHRLSLSAYWNEVHDLIGVGTLAESPGFTRFGYVNVANASIRGGELAAETGSTWLGLGAAYVLTDAVDRATGLPLEGRARHRGALDLRLSRAGTRLTSRAALVGPRPFAAPTDGTGRIVAPAYAQLDAKLQQDLGDHLALFIGVDNALNAGDPELLPLPPRLLFAGIDGRLGSSSSRPRGTP